MLDALIQQADDPELRIVLNGLPRHVGQAVAIEEILPVDTVVSLTCNAETVCERIRTNIGGDREGRIDDDLLAIRKKLAIFADRTAPLIEYYQCRGSRIVTLEVTVSMSPMQMWQALQLSIPNATLSGHD